MKRYTLLKDLPYAQAGEILEVCRGGIGDYITLYRKGEQTHQFKVNAYMSSNFDEWFEEVEELKKYYYIGSMGHIKTAECKGWEMSLKLRKMIGNYFETEEEAEEYLKYIKAKAVIKESANEFKPDWNNHSQRKFYGAWVVEARRPCLCSDDELQHRTIYFKTGEALLKSFDNHPDEWKTYLTYEQQG